jgi:hypothetical protein
MAYIQPTPGRVVLFWSRRDDNIAKLPGQPLAAIISGVLTTVGKVNLSVFDAKGVPHGYENITLIQEGDARPDGDFAEWMLYQKGQAAKTEAAEKALAAAVPAG